MGFEDECWWSRFEQACVSTWSEEAIQLVQQERDKEDKTPKAIACYGVVLSCPADATWSDQVWIRFVDGRPVSSITTQFLQWGCEQLEAHGKRVWVLIWDNASWHRSKEVRHWIGDHNQQVKQSGKGVRILRCQLPVKSPWLNPIEPRWAHAKKKLVEPNATLTPDQLEQRVCDYFDQPTRTHLSKYVS